MILATIDTDTFDPEFDHVYLIDGLGVITDNATGIYAPDVEHHADFDILINGMLATGAPDEWRCLTGHTGQHGYRGAVMHASEQWGNWAIQDLASRTEEDGYVAFAVVEVRDENGDYPEGDPIGWAVVYRVVH